LRSTLFVIPHELYGIPLFGFGILLAGLVFAYVGWSAWMLTRKKSIQEVIGGLPVWLIAAAIVAFIVPNVELRLADGSPIGLPIRGYGVMVLIGLLAGIGITSYRGEQLGIATDTVIGLGFWMMLGGILGARTCYFVQKLQEFNPPGLIDKQGAILKLTEGGLVIYGGVIGGLVAGGIYCYRHKLRLAATADLIAPGFLIGLSVGRIGCLLHGCCFGGVCAADLPTIQFPKDSGPYHSQLASGQLLGIELDDKHQPPGTVERIAPGSPADLAGVPAGRVLQSVEVNIAGDGSTARSPIDPLPLRADAVVADQRFTFLPSQLPDASLPVHPSQIYASINALLLCLLIWHLQPLPRHDGVTFLVAILLYALSRFLLEGVRSDEVGQLGTPFTIAQLVAIASGLVAITTLWVTARLPAGRSWSWPQT
jgi:phosphatidylglycerol:prolipoprotein diacylglycerol transferase